jgi:glutathione S-transferase
MAGLVFEEKVVDPDDPVNRAELLMQSSSIRVPALVHDDVMMWDTLAIAEYLNETFPNAGMLPTERAARAHCRSIAGEMHSGFSALREALPMNLKLYRPGFAVWSAVQADIDRITEIWRDCLASSKGPWLFGAKPTIADAMYAPVVTRFRSYDVEMHGACERYCKHIMAWSDMREWFAAAQKEPEQIDELDIEF